MNTKTMEGLVGARTNMNLLNVPLRVYKEARQKGDTGTMERAMGFVDDYSGKAEEYAAKADEGMKEEAEEAREKAKSEREKAIQKRDTVEISEDACPDRDNPDNSPLKEETVKAEPMIYMKTGKAEQKQSDSGTYISVSV